MRLSTSLPTIGPRLLLATMLFVFALLAQRALHLPFQLAFAQSAFNYWAVAWTFMMIPVLGWWMSRSLAPASQRRVDIGMVVLFFPCLFVAIACVLAAPVVGEADDSYVLVSEAQAGWPAYRLYQTNCGTACSVGLVLKEERDLVAGLKLVSPKWARYKVENGRVELGASTVRVMNRDTVIGEVAR